MYFWAMPSVEIRDQLKSPHPAQTIPFERPSFPHSLLIPWAVLEPAQAGSVSAGVFRSRHVSPDLGTLLAVFEQWIKAVNALWLGVAGKQSHIASLWGSGLLSHTLNPDTFRRSWAVVSGTSGDRSLKSAHCALCGFVPDRSY